MGDDTSPLRVPAPDGRPARYTKDQIVSYLRGTNPEAVSASGQSYLDFADSYRHMRTNLRAVADDLAYAWKGPAAADAQRELRDLFIAAHEMHSRASQVGAAVKTHGDSYLAWYKNDMPTPETDADAQAWMGYANRRLGETWHALPPELTTGLPPATNESQITEVGNGPSAHGSEPVSASGPVSASRSGPAGAHSSDRHGTGARFEFSSPHGSYGPPGQGRGSHGTELAGYTADVASPTAASGAGSGTPYGPPGAAAPNVPGFPGGGPSGVPGSVVGGVPDGGGGGAPDGGGSVVSRPGGSGGPGGGGGLGGRLSPVVPAPGGPAGEGRAGTRRPSGRPVPGVADELEGTSSSRPKADRRDRDKKKTAPEDEPTEELTDRPEAAGWPDQPPAERVDENAERAEEATDQVGEAEDVPEEETEDPFAELEAEVSLDDLDLPTDWALGGLALPESDDR